MDRASRALLTHTRVWWVCNAASQRPGRLAAQIATVLQGKHKPIFHPGVDCGDHVVVLNTADVEFSGSKWDKKKYIRHTQWPGGLREELAKHLHARKPEEVMRKAVWGMLPRNKLRYKAMDRLHLFADENHPYAANIHSELHAPREDSGRRALAHDVLRAPGELNELNADDKEFKLVFQLPRVE